MSIGELDDKIEYCKEQIVQIQKEQTELISRYAKAIAYIEQVIKPLRSARELIVSSKKCYIFYEHWLFGSILKSEYKKSVKVLENNIKNADEKLNQIIQKSSENTFYMTYLHAEGDVNRNFSELQRQMSKNEYSLKQHNVTINECNKFLQIQIEKYERKNLAEERKKERNRLKLEGERKKQEEISAKLASAEKKSREEANKRKKDIKINDYCPYCGKVIFNGHVDHIYPIAKGGLSTTVNMVYICATCNLQKSNLTLNQFISKFELDRDFIENNLTNLNKCF